MERVLRYILFMTPGFAAGIFVWLLLLAWRRNQISSGKLRECALCLFLAYCGGMAAITLSPEPGWLFTGLAYGYWYSYFDVSGLSYRVSLLPFSQLDSVFNVAGNIVMFLPFGFFAALLWRGWSWKRALALGLGVTCAIECWQILVGRYFDVDDIILNTLGVFCGYLLWTLLKGCASGFAEKFHVNEEHR